MYQQEELPNAPATPRQSLTIKGLSFIIYKHWSYDGNVGVYLPDGISCIGELINGEPVWSTKLTIDEKKWIQANYPEHYDLCLAVRNSLMYLDLEVGERAKCTAGYPYKGTVIVECTRNFSEAEGGYEGFANTINSPGKWVFFGLAFGNEKITIKVLESIAEFIEEGKILHHCVGGKNYWGNHDSLVMSARIDGKPVETIELSLKSMKIIQSRGLQNQATEHHGEVLKLVRKNMHIITEAKKKAKNHSKEVAA